MDFDKERNLLHHSSSSRRLRRLSPCVLCSIFVVLALTLSLARVSVRDALLSASERYQPGAQSLDCFADQRNSTQQRFTSVAYKESLAGVDGLARWEEEEVERNDGLTWPRWIGEANKNAGDVRILKEKTEQSLQARTACLETKTCAMNQEKIVIVHDQDHLSAVMGNQFGGGEVVWARSFETGLQALGYTLVYLQGSLTEVSHVVNEQLGGWNAMHLVISNCNRVRECANQDDCALSHANNSKGVPLWKVLSMCLWAGEDHPLGGEWEVNIEDHSWTGSRNRFLGYSIEGCARTPYIAPEMRYGSATRAVAHTKSRWQLEKAPLLPELAPGMPASEKRSAFILAKRTSYFGVQNRPFGEEQFRAAAEQLPIRFEIGAHNDSGEIMSYAKDRPTPLWLQDDNLFENHGLIRPQLFVPTVSAASVMIGIGNPVLSPSPYEALCVGVPFINPITDWDRNWPKNRFAWSTQHNAMRFLDPPYVYHVFANDTQGFVDALRSAIENPIDRYILPRMRQEHVNERLRDIMGRNYRVIAEKVMRERKDGGRIFDI